MLPMNSIMQHDLDVMITRAYFFKSHLAERLQNLSSLKALGEISGYLYSRISQFEYELSKLMDCSLLITLCIHSMNAGI
jgi:hypothetical protein